MAGKLADRQQARHEEIAKFSESKTDGSAPAKPKQEPETRSTGKKYVGYYLPADLVKWIKRQAVELEIRDSHLVQRILEEYRAKQKR